jgi:hypothetical protein
MTGGGGATTRPSPLPVPSRARVARGATPSSLRLAGRLLAIGDAAGARFEGPRLEANLKHKMLAIADAAGAATRLGSTLCSEGWAEHGQFTPYFPYAGLYCIIIFNL